MTEMPAPVARIDAVRLVEAVNRATGAGIRFVGAAGQGEVGAGFVAWPNGDAGVITRTGADLNELVRTRHVLARADAAGLPVPGYRLIADLGTERAVVQDRLPGEPPDAWSTELGAQLMTVVDRCAGLGDDLPVIELYLRSSGPGFCLHETLRVFDDRTRQLLDRIREIGAVDGTTEASSAEALDLVHLDFHLGNVLVVDGQLSGVVDWDGYGRGDRRLMLTTLLFDLGHAVRFRPEFGVGPTALQPILDRLQQALPASVRRWWAHMTLRQVDWTIRHRYPTEVIEHYLRFASVGLDRLTAGDRLRVRDLVPPPAVAQNQDSNR